MSNFKNNYTAIVCKNNNGAIGKDGQLLYKINSDLKNFKSLTIGNVVIMGRKTFESLPNRLPLKDRVNIILTSDENYTIDTDKPELFNDTYVCNSFEDVDNLCYAFFKDKEFFIIGGEKLYNETYVLGVIDKAIVTLVNDDAEGDVYFPDLDRDENYKTIFKTSSLRDGQDIYYRYIIYKKRQ